MQLVLGATGGIGHWTVVKLVERGEPVRVLVRDPEKFRKAWPGANGIEVVAGDALVADDVRRAAQDVTAIFHCVNVPYHEWAAKAFPMLTNTIAAAQATGARIVFPGNVYVFGHARSKFVAEDHPMAPQSRKGQLRLRMEQRLAELHRSEGLAFTIVRMPDFYGPFVVNRLYTDIFRNALRGAPMRWYGDLDVPFEFLYVPDGGDAVVRAGLDPSSNGETYHVPGAGVIAPREFLQLVARASGTASRPQAVPGWMVALVGIGNPDARELREMLYLRRERFLLDGSKFRQKFGVLPTTPYETGVRTTLDWFRANP
ncbi:MAG TPA: NAD-dependent epimerase/dehydratase family protein [Thermoplasmata archaeon]|jgi:nucleoside-diphosphate-sugar epimerase|nr:NAD-dependent epimerase/dehydratase family protein [Thermoplasmata archaeon]